MNYRKNISVFKYEILGSSKHYAEIAGKINEELNKGLSFTILEADEKVIFLRSKRRNWIYCDRKDKNLYISVYDKFFRASIIIEQILTSLWTNLMDFGGIRLIEYNLSKNINAILLSKCNKEVSIDKLTGSKGPYFGMVFKPSFNLSLKQRIGIAKKFISIGGTFLKEDETYLIDRNELIENASAIQDAINKISLKGFYVPNVTSYLLDGNIFRQLYKAGIRIVMVNYLMAGLPTIAKIRNNFENMLLWGHRVGYSTIEKYISMEAISSLAIHSGIDVIHIGTPFIALKISVERCRKILESVRQINKKSIPVFTKTSHHIVPHLVKLFGNDIVIMACGSLRTSGNINWNKVMRWIDAIKYA